MTGYFSSIADRGRAAPSGAVDRALARPEPPAPPDRDVLEDPFESIVEDGDWQSSTSDLDTAGPPGPTPRSPDPTPRSELPPIAQVDSAPVDRSATPSMFHETASNPEAADEHIDAQGEPIEQTSDDAERVGSALRAMDEMLFRAAGIEPASDLPDAPLEPRTPIADPRDAVPASEMPLPQDHGARDVVDPVQRDAVPSAAPPTFTPATGQHSAPDAALMAPQPDVVEIEPPPASVNIGRITVEVREPQPASTPVSDHPETTAPRGASFPRAQRLLSPQPRRLG